MRKRSGVVTAFIALGLALVAQPARADYVTHTVNFTLSSDLANNVVYGMVFLEAYDGVGEAGGGLFAGQVRITASADVAPYSGVSKNFGLQQFGFNTDLALNASDISGPDGWSLVADSHLGEFGRFNWLLAGVGGPRQNPLEVLVSNLGASATIDHFLHLSQMEYGAIQPDSVHFAAQVAGIEGEPSLHDVGGLGWPIPIEEVPPGGGGPVLTSLPEPSTLALAILGLGGFTPPLLRRLLRRKKEA